MENFPLVENFPLPKKNIKLHELEHSAEVENFPLLVEKMFTLMIFFLLITDKSTTLQPNLRKWTIVHFSQLEKNFLLHKEKIIPKSYEPDHSAYKNFSEKSENWLRIFSTNSPPPPPQPSHPGPSQVDQIGWVV